MLFPKIALYFNIFLFIFFIELIYFMLGNRKAQEFPWAFRDNFKLLTKLTKLNFVIRLVLGKMLFCR